jgi:hypothetical protein
MSALSGLVTPTAQTEIHYCTRAGIETYEHGCRDGMLINIDREKASTFWYFNVGQTEKRGPVHCRRRWDDSREYGFVSAGRNPKRCAKFTVWPR